LRVPKRRKPNPPAPPEAKILGRRIQQLREARGWNQQQLADAVEFDRAYVGGVEAGLRNPTFRNLLRFARALRIPLSELVDGLR
jgi:transcriptional regulator with XRE-family HTH domain